MKRTLIAACLVSATACIPHSGRLEKDRFQHHIYPYAVFYGPDGAPLAPFKSWRTDNFFLDGSKRYRAKQGGAWQVVRTYDIDDDGRSESKSTDWTYDLLIEHTQRDAIMRLQTFPISLTDRDKELDVLAQRYVHAASGEGSFAVRVDENSAVGVSRRYAAHTLSKQPCSVSRREAVQIDFEVANVDELQLSSDARLRRGRAVFVRTGYEHVVQTFGQAHNRLTPFPVVMMLGLWAEPEDFASLEADFDTFLRHTVLGDSGEELTMNGESTCGSLATGSARGEAPTNAEPSLVESKGDQDGAVERPPVSDAPPEDTAP